MNKNIVLATLCAIALMLSAGLIHAFFSTMRDKSSMVKQLDSFKSHGVSTEVFAVKSGERSCLVFVSKPENAPHPQYALSCNQEM